MKPTRRSFLRTTLAASLGPFILPSGLRAATNANDRLNFAFIGIGKMGGGLLGDFLSRPDVVVTAVCDVDTNRRNAAQATVEKRYSENKPTGWKGCSAHNDFREILADDSIDAVVIATPDHWHAVIAIAAARAGKDIYCEKPLVQTVREGIALIDAIRDNKRVLQTGSQQRSSREFRVACEIVRNNGIGKISRVETAFAGPGIPCDLPEQEMEPGLDWDFWQGPAPARAYNEILAPRGVHNHFPMWRKYREYGGGMVTDWGAHHVDIAQWGLGMDASGPQKIIAPENARSAQHGVKLLYAGDIELLHTPPNEGNGVSFFGADGEVHVSRGNVRVIHNTREIAKHWGQEGDLPLGQALDTLDEHFLLKDAKTKLQDSGGHHANFIACIRNREKPITNEEIGSRSIIACHLMNFAYYNGSNFDWNPGEIAFTNNTGDKSWLHYDYRGEWKI